MELEKQRALKDQNVSFLNFEKEKEQLRIQRDDKQEKFKQIEKQKQELFFKFEKEQARW